LKPDLLEDLAYMISPYPRESIFYIEEDGKLVYVPGVDVVDSCIQVGQSHTD